MLLHALIVIDGNGESEIVSLCLVEHEDKETLTKLMTEFKNIMKIGYPYVSYQIEI